MLVMLLMNVDQELRKQEIERRDSPEREPIDPDRTGML